MTTPVPYYQFPVSPGRYVRLSVPHGITPVEWDRMMLVLGLFRDGLVTEPEPESVTTFSGQQLKFDRPYEEVE